MKLKFRLICLFGLINLLVVACATDKNAVTIDQNNSVSATSTTHNTNYHETDNNSSSPYLSSLSHNFALSNVSSTFNINGRFFIKTAQKSETGNFVWAKNNQNEELDFTNPLGGVMAKFIINNDGVVKFIDLHRQEYTGSDLDQIMQKQLGFVLPLKKMHYWIQGVAIPNVPLSKQFNDGFSQLNWQVKYLMWYNSKQPKLIKLESKDFMIKLLVTWN